MGNTFEWIACPADQWRHSHNYMHHTYTNIQGKDRDIGYAILRMSEDERWRPYYLGNPIYATLLAIFFQYGVALHDLETERIARGTWNLEEKRAMLGEMWRKVRAQTLKDYVLFPVLSWSLLPARDRRQRDCQPGTQPVGVHDHLLRALPRRDLRVHQGADRERDARESGTTASSWARRT